MFIVYITTAETSKNNPSNKRKKKIVNFLKIIFLHSYLYTSVI